MRKTSSPNLKFSYLSLSTNSNNQRKKKLNQKSEHLMTPRPLIKIMKVMRNLSSSSNKRSPHPNSSKINRQAAVKRRREETRRIRRSEFQMVKIASQREWREASNKESSITY